MTYLISASVRNVTNHAVKVAINQSGRIRIEAVKNSKYELEVEKISIINTSKIFRKSIIFIMLLLFFKCAFF